MDQQLLAHKDTLCCICHFVYKPGHKIALYHPCNHPVHSRCYKTLKLSGFRRRCPMDNLKKRTVTKFRINPNIVDARVFEEGDEEEHPEEEDEDEDSLICCFCVKTIGKVFAYKECYSCGGEYHVSCAWEAIGFKDCYGEGCEVKLSSMADLKGKVRRNGAVDYSSHSTSSSSSSGSCSGSEALAAGAAEEDRETDLVFDMDL